MAGIVNLIFADAVGLLLGGALQPTWGIFLNGSPVVQPASFLNPFSLPAFAPVQAVAQLLGATNILPVTASTIDFEYAQDFPISTYPQEEGAFQAYNKVTLPFDVKVKMACGGSASRRQAFLSTMLAISKSFAQFDVVTPELTFPSVNCSHISWPRRAKQNNGLIAVELWFKEIPVEGQANFTNTAQPGIAGQQAVGNVQPLAPNQRVQQGFDSLTVM